MNTPISYRIIRSDRKTMALQMAADGSLTVRCPKSTTAEQIDRFVNSKRDWIAKHMATRTPQRKLPPLSNADIRALAKKASEVIPQRVRYYAPIVGVNYGTITIRNQKSRWGSCTSAGNLNFNCLLMLTPMHIIDYVVVHELCHRLEMNHSERFWAQVSRVIPDWKTRRKWLKENGSAIIRSMTGQ